MTDDPRSTIDHAPMSRFQWTVVAIMVGLNALDGFDVLSISFASPGIAKEWGIARDALGLVLSMELVGMAVGSLLLGVPPTASGGGAPSSPAWSRWRAACSAPRRRTTWSACRCGG